MKRKFLVTILAAITAIACALPLAACKDGAQNSADKPTIPKGVNLETVETENVMDEYSEFAVNLRESAENATVHCYSNINKVTTEKYDNYDVNNTSYKNLTETTSYTAETTSHYAIMKDDTEGEIAGYSADCHYHQTRKFNKKMPDGYLTDNDNVTYDYKPSAVLKNGNIYGMMDGIILNCRPDTYNWKTSRLDNAIASIIYYNRLNYFTPAIIVDNDTFYWNLRATVEYILSEDKENEAYQLGAIYGYEYDSDTEVTIDKLSLTVKALDGKLYIDLSLKLTLDDTGSTYKKTSTVTADYAFYADTDTAVTKEDIPLGKIPANGAKVTVDNFKDYAAKDVLYIADDEESVLNGLINANEVTINLLGGGSLDKLTCTLSCFGLYGYNEIELSPENGVIKLNGADLEGFDYCILDVSYQINENLKCYCSISLDLQH